MGGYSGSLFDPQGPGRFASSLRGVTDAMGDVVAGVVQLGEKSTVSLIGISKQYDELIEKAGQFNVVRGQDPAQSRVGAARNWDTAPANAGQTGGGRVPPSAPTHTPFGSGTPSGAMMAIGSAAAGAAQRFVAANKSAVVQAGISGQQYANWFGGGRGDYMTIPIIQGTAGFGGRGTEAYTVGGQADYVQSQRIMALQMGIRPLSTNPSQPPSPVARSFNTTLNTAMLMDPGQTRAGATQAFAGMYSGSAIQSMAAIGISARPGGVPTDPYTIFEQLFQKTYPSQALQAKLNQDDIANALTPGGPLEKNFEAAGLDPNGDLYSQFEEYMYARQSWVQQNPGKTIPSGAALQSAFKLDQGPAAAALKKNSRQAQAKSLLTPSQATVDEKIDNAATALTKVAEQLAGTNTATGKGLLGQLGTALGVGGKVAGPVLGAVAAAAGLSGGIPGVGGGGGPGAGINDQIVSGAGKVLTPQMATLMSATATAPPTQSPIGLGGLLAAATGITASGGFDWYGSLAAPTTAVAPNFQVTAQAAARVGTGTSSNGNSGSDSSNGTGTALTPTGTTDLGSGSNLAKGYNYFVIKGLADYQSAGIIGNLMEESGMNPASVQKGGPGRGIAQWSVGERWNGVLALAKTENKDPTDLGLQLDYLWQELNTTEKSSLTALQATKNVDDATASFEKTFERAGVPAMAVRQANAESVLAKAHKGTLARGSYNVERTQLALVHKGERVIPAADNFSVSDRYRRLNSPGSGTVKVHKNFPAGAIQLQVPANPSSSDFDKLAQQFAAAVTKVGATRASRAS